MVKKTKKNKTLKTIFSTPALNRMVGYRPAQRTKYMYDLRAVHVTVGQHKPHRQTRIA